MSAKPIPADYHSLMAHLMVEGATEAIAFYEKSFGAHLLSRAPDPTGKKVWHAALRIGDSVLMLNDVFPEMGATKSDSHMWHYVEDVDATYQQAIAAGGKEKSPPADMFWGDRVGHFDDPFGQHWSIATRKHDLTPEQMMKAGLAMVEKMKAARND